MSEITRRRKIVMIAPSILHELLSPGPARYIQCIDGVPANARFIGHDYDVLRDAHYLVFDSDDWEPVPFGQILPEQHVSYREFSVISLLTRAETLLQSIYSSDVDQWLDEWRRLREYLIETRE